MTTTVVRTEPFDARRIAEESAELDASKADWAFTPELDARQAMEVIAWLNKLGVMDTYLCRVDEDGRYCFGWLGNLADEERP